MSQCQAHCCSTKEPLLLRQRCHFDHLDTKRNWLLKADSSLSTLPISPVGLIGMKPGMKDTGCSIWNTKPHFLKHQAAFFSKLTFMNLIQGGVLFDLRFIKEVRSSRKPFQSSYFILCNENTNWPSEIFQTLVPKTGKSIFTFDCPVSTMPLQ